MVKLVIRYAEGPARGFPENALTPLGESRVFSLGHKEGSRFQLPQKGVQSRHAVIYTPSASPGTFHISPRDGVVSIRVPSGKAFKDYSSLKESVQLVHGLRFRIGPHTFEVVDTDKGAKSAVSTPAPVFKPAGAKPSAPAPSAPSKPAASGRSKLASLASAAISGVKSMWSSPAGIATSKPEQNRTIYRVTSEERPRAKIPRPVSDSLASRNKEVLKRVVNYGLREAHRVATERRERAHKALSDSKYGTRQRESAQFSYDESVAFQKRIGSGYSGRSSENFIRKMQLRDPANPGKLRPPTRQELDLGTHVIYRDLLGKEVIDLAVVPKIHDENLVGHEVHVMLPQLIKPGMRIAKALSRYFKHDVHLVTYPFPQRPKGTR